MISIVWRGAGILVIIALVISAWLTGYAFEDESIRNLEYVKWVLLWAGIPLFLIGLGLSPLHKDETTGKWKYIGGHDLFFIPMFVWGLIFIGFSLKYFIVGTEVEDNTYRPEMSQNIAVENPNDADPATELASQYPNNHRGISPDERVVKLYNPTNEEIEIELIDDKGIYKKQAGYVPPLEVAFIKVKASDYTLKFDGKIRKASVSGSTALEDQNRDELWFVLSGNTDLLLVDATITCDPKLKTIEEFKAIDFSKHVYKRFDGAKPIEMKVEAGNKYMTIRDPYYTLPVNITDEEQIFSIIPIPKSQETTDAFIDDFLASICFKTEGVTVH